MRGVSETGVLRRSGGGGFKRYREQRVVVRMGGEGCVMIGLIVPGVLGDERAGYALC